MISLEEDIGGFYPDNYTSLWKKAEAIPGHVTRNEGFLLYLLGKQQCLHGNVVEVGSFHGRSSVLLGSGMLEREDRRRKLICIDNFVKQSSRSFPHAINPKEALLDNIRRFDLSNLFELYEMNSEQALRSISPESCGLIFIDSEHIESQISEEFPLALTAINRNGVILIHDYMNPNVDPSYTWWIQTHVQANYETIFIQDSTPSYRGNGLLVVKPKTA